jgi:hypothetical protein
VKELTAVKFNAIKLHGIGLLALLCLLLAPGCKDEEPCDDGQESIGTVCYPAATGGSAGSSSLPQAGAPGEGGAADPAGGASGSEPPGNPDATFGTPCQANDECGGDAPICATDPLFYCSQIDCSAGEANDGACPAGWTCFPKAPDHPSACVNLQ